MASWTNTRAIIRDLEKAQGGAPIAIEQPISFNQRPPREIFEEETEEEFYRDTCPGGDFSSGPDISVIKEMLELVRTSNSSPEGDQVTISKPDTKEFIPKSITQNIQIENNSQNTTPKKRRNRNAVLESLNKCNEEISSTSNTPKGVQYMPTAMQNKNLTPEPVKSQNGTTRDWLSPIDSRSMFKKKSSSPLTTKSPVPTQSQVKEQKQNVEVFVPTSNATQYYEKFVERNKRQETYKNDIWSRLEKLLAEIDERKRLERQHATEGTSNSQGEASSNLEQELAQAITEIEAQNKEDSKTEN